MLPKDLDIFKFNFEGSSKALWAIKKVSAFYKPS